MRKFTFLLWILSTLLITFFLCWKKRWNMYVEQPFCDHMEINHELWKAEQKDKMAWSTADPVDGLHLDFLLHNKK